MWTYPAISPVAVDFGSIVIHWYGLMYVLGCVMGWLMGRALCRVIRTDWSKEMVDDVVFYIAIGMVLGGRIGYILFYNFEHYIANPLSVLQIWQGGMSFHGGLIGVTLALLLFAKQHKVSLFAITDFVAVCVPPGLGAGRIGNFINGELWGKIAPVDSFFGMKVFDPTVNAVLVRYPTQLLEFVLEGVLLLIVLVLWSRTRPPAMVLSGAFLFCYGLFRSIVEFWRLPDSHIGYIAGDWLTMGHVLCIPMLALGAYLIYIGYQRKVSYR